ncbi:MAG: UDP-glucose 4-epimerase [Elusimicrobia bacterium RIFOXYA2_FULL_39_19]|nr:MAG: UDP-glucose 4-epimerase [Elusimicrobia bacterium RIFOXYA2_FULL_39_19]
MIKHNILITGGAGYVGTVLTKKLVALGHDVKVIDLCIYGEEVLGDTLQKSNFKLFKGDIRDRALLETSIPGSDTVIHLACISNDPSYELNPDLSKTINYDAFVDILDISKKSGVSKFIFASSSSVYGVKETENVTENLSLEPLTDYSKYKALCEELLLKEQIPQMTSVILRPATVCGYSPRLRLDLTVNILTAHAINKNKITVFGGNQKRPNIHIDDIVDYYIALLDMPKEKIAGNIFNAGYENHTVSQIAEIVKEALGKDIPIDTVPSDDNRSYHISSAKIQKELGLAPKKTIRDAVLDIKNAFETGEIKNWDDINYYNVKKMKTIGFK